MAAGTFELPVRPVPDQYALATDKVLTGLPVYLSRRLQSVLNAAARLIFGLRRSECSDHVSDALISLHWLRIPQRIQCKVAVLTYKVLHGCAPSYLGPFVRVAVLPSRRALRSANIIAASSSHSPTGPPLATEPFLRLFSRGPILKSS